MVDSIGSRPTVPQRTVAPVVATARTAPAATRRDETVAAQREVTALAFDLDKPSPVAEAHVAEIRRAIRNGTYPILPETIADRMLALKLNWSPKK